MGGYRHTTIGFLTDYGLADEFVGVCHGVMRRLAPEASVIDISHGIAPHDLRRIFEPFYTTKGRGKGTGLGLAICRELTAALGGTISVHSEPGQGSTVYVRLPRDGAPAGSGPMTTSTTQPRLRIATGGRG